MGIAGVCPFIVRLFARLFVCSFDSPNKPNEQTDRQPLSTGLVCRTQVKAALTQQPYTVLSRLPGIAEPKPNDSIPEPEAGARRAGQAAWMALVASHLAGEALVRLQGVLTTWTQLRHGGRLLFQRMPPPVVRQLLEALVAWVARAGMSATSTIAFDLG